MLMKGEKYDEILMKLQFGAESVRGWIRSRSCDEGEEGGGIDNEMMTTTTMKMMMKAMMWQRSGEAQ